MQDCGIRLDANSSLAPAPSLVDSPLLNEFSRAFHGVTGLPIQLHAPGDFKVGQSPGVPALCRVLAVSRKACRECVDTHLALQDSVGLSTQTTKCFAGLTSSAVPVVWRGDPVAFLHTGHALVEGSEKLLPPATETRRRQPSSTSLFSQSTDSKPRPPSVSGEVYQGALGLLRTFSHQLADTLIPESGGTNYSVIAHLVRRMRNDVANDWRLPKLARVAGMHPSYFSEQFRRHTGSTLTEFLTDLRVEKARQLLELTAYSMSDIAFASGFRSISQFNRVFRARVGCTPSEIRASRRPLTLG